MSKSDDRAKELKDGLFKKGILVGRRRNDADDVELTARERKALQAENEGGYGRVLVAGKWFKK